MRAARTSLVLVVVLSIAFVTTASAALPSAPTGLRGFELRPNDTPSRTFTRTPAFAWNPVRGASCYEFELATSRSFNGSSVIWSNVSTDANSGKHCTPVKVSFQRAAAPADESQSTGNQEGETTAQETVRFTIPPIRVPATSINLTLPWFTGKGPFALYAHVRSVTTQGASAWSHPYSFDMRWENGPTPQSARPGLVRWTPVEGATMYQVWLGGRGPTHFPNRIISTHTNVADLRDAYTFHLDESWWRTVEWRVRAIRQVVGAIPNGLPAVSYGPWSPIYATTNPGWTSGKIRLGAAVSDRISSGGLAPAHYLMPALTWTGDQSLEGNSYRLFRVYIATDRDCVNIVFRGAVVGGPAWAPRLKSLLKLPASQDDIDAAQFSYLPLATSEGAKATMADNTPVTATETANRVDLPDLDLETTRYFWTVVPVGVVVDDSGAFTYTDVEIPQDACQAGRVSVFGKDSQAAQTTGGGPYVSGLTPKGRLLQQAAGARPAVFATPLVAWRPVVGATEYEVQWSRTAYPWRKRGARLTVATSSVLSLSRGTWYYRVRGLNAAQVGTPAMTWSTPVALRIVNPTFRITHG
jgi:hypothetical protein